MAYQFFTWQVTNSCLLKKMKCQVNFFLGDGLGWEFLSCFVSKYPRLTLDPKEQTVFSRGAVFFLGEDGWIVC